MAKSKSVRSSVLFSKVAQTIRSQRADAIKAAAMQQHLLTLVKGDPMISGLIEALNDAVKATGASIKRKETAERRKGNVGNVIVLPRVDAVALYVGRTYDYAPGAPVWEVLVRADITHLSGFKDAYLTRTLDAWLEEAEAKHYGGSASRPAASIKTQDEAEWHTRKYHMTWDFAHPSPSVRIKATLAAHIRNDSPTCRQEVVTTEEVIERKQYRLICA